MGFELFEFIEPKYEGYPSETFGPKHFLRGGPFHIGVTMPDPEEFCRNLEKVGAKKLGDTIKTATWTAVFIQDPWGTVFEIVSIPYESTAPGPQAKH